MIETKAGIGKETKPHADAFDPGVDTTALLVKRILEITELEKFENQEERHQFVHEVIRIVQAVAFQYRSARVKRGVRSITKMKKTVTLLKSGTGQKPVASGE
jgi:hypothetical protein